MLHNRENILCHYRNRLLYIKVGLKVTKVHRVLEMSQKRYLKKLIRMNPTFGQSSTNAFRKCLYYLAYNALFGKFMLTPRWYSHIKIETTPEVKSKFQRKVNLK